MIKLRQLEQVEEYPHLLEQSPHQDSRSSDRKDTLYSKPPGVVTEATTKIEGNPYSIVV